jgi:hypothetical protein
MVQQINNIENGQVLKIKQVKGNIADVMYFNSDSDNVNFDFKQIEIEGLNDLIYNQLKNNLGNIFETSTENINWLFKGEDRLIRMKIPDSLYVEETLNGSVFGQLMLSLLDYFKRYTFHSNHLNIIYFEEILPDSFPVINPYVIKGLVIIEKLVYNDEIEKHEIVRINNLNELL